jgi:transposase
MTTQRKQYSAEFKARVAMEALKGHKTMNELVSMYGVHPTQITKWKHHLQSELPQMFSNRRDKRDQDHEALIRRYLSDHALSSLTPTRFVIRDFKDRFEV